MEKASVELRMTNTQIIEETAKLVDAWCERRCLMTLGFVLQGFPLHCYHTDGWGDLLLSLDKALLYGKKEMTPKEVDTLREIIAALKSWNW